MSRKTFFVAWGCVLAVALYAGRGILLPFVLATVLAYVLTPAVARLEKKKVPRAAAIILVYIVGLGSLTLFGRLTAPRVGTELAGLKRELPTIGKQVQEDWVPRVQARLQEWGLAQPKVTTETVPKDEPALTVTDGPEGSLEVNVKSGINVRADRRGGYVVEPVHPEEQGEAFDVNKIVAESARKSVDYARKNALEIAQIGQEVLRRVSRFIFMFSLTLMLAAYIMLTRERIVGFFRGLVRPSGRFSFDTLMQRIDKGLSGVIRGQLVICLVNGVLSAIGFAIVGLKYWPVMALVATVFSLIPIFGSIASSVPAVALGLTQSFGTAAFVLIWIIVIHQVEANLLNPKIMGDAAKIHPVLVIFSLLLGEHLFHTVGALLAVPSMSIAQSLFIHFRSQMHAADPDFVTEGVASIPPARLAVLKAEPPEPSESDINK
jgi:predicted PurR-regulated permease PerM